MGTREKTRNVKTNVKVFSCDYCHLVTTAIALPQTKTTISLERRTMKIKLSPSAYGWSVLSRRHRPLKWTTVGGDMRRRQGKTQFLSCVTHHCKCSVTRFFPQAERLSCVYENSLEKSTLYKHSGPLDLSMLGSSNSIYPTVLTGLGLISLSRQLDGLSSRQEMLLSAPNQDCLPVGAVRTVCVFTV